MTGRDVLRRLEAWDAGRPLPRGATRRLALTDPSRQLIVAFVRMGGESLPWGVAVAHPGRVPEVLTVPEPRDRDAVAGMLIEFAPRLMRHLGHPELDPEPPDADPATLPLRQLWVPNPSHVAMLHLLSYRYTFARRGEPMRIALLNALGRAANWCFSEAQRAGQASVIDATAALRAAFEFPVDDLRQQHLGLLLALLETAGEREARMAAAETAESQPVSTSLDPDLERDELEPALERRREAMEREDAAAVRRCEQRIADVLEDELRRRIALTERAISLLRADVRPVNRGAEDLAADSTRERLEEYVRRERRLVDDERTFVPDPETDRHPSAAAAYYLKHTAAAEQLHHALVHHDAELQDETIANGDGLRGTIVAVQDRSKNPRATLPFWTIEGPARGSFRLRIGSGVCVAGLPKRAGRIRELSISADGTTRRVVVEITGWKTKPNQAELAHVPHAADQSLVGTEVTLLAGHLGFLPAIKRQKVWNRFGPGAWLTHNAGPPPAADRGRVPDPLVTIAELRAS